MANAKANQRAKAGLRERLGYLSDGQVAAVLGVAIATLRNRRSRGDAPVSSKVGVEHLTTQSDLHAFIARRRREPRRA
jgi:hypothetical protein